jgi:hypothetical protein
MWDTEEICSFDTWVGNVCQTDRRHNAQGKRDYEFAPEYKLAT